MKHELTASTNKKCSRNRPCNDWQNFRSGSLKIKEINKKKGNMFCLIDLSRRIQLEAILLTVEKSAIAFWTNVDVDPMNLLVVTVDQLVLWRFKLAATNRAVFTFDESSASPKTLVVFDEHLNKSNRKTTKIFPLGIRFKLVHHLLHINEEKLSATIEELNRDSNVDGILLQLPLPLHLIEKTNSFVETIRSDKDVDGHSQMNNNFFRHASKPIVTIPVVAAVREILLEIGESIRGKNVVVLGRSKFVGTPIALMLSQSTQTSEYPLISAGNVTICHRETPINDLVRFCKNADLIISAVGRPSSFSETIKKRANFVSSRIHNETNDQRRRYVDRCWNIESLDRQTVAQQQQQQ